MRTNDVHFQAKGPNGQGEIFCKNDSHQNSASRIKTSFPANNKNVSNGRNNGRHTEGDKKVEVLACHPELLSNNQLISLLAENPRSETLWREFMRRFQKYIIATISRKCIHLNYSEGLNKMDDLLHEVYLKLLQNNAKALKDFKGSQKNAIIKYLFMITVNVIRNEFGKYMRQKRKTNGGFIYLDENWHLHEKKKSNLHEILKDSHCADEMHTDELMEEIEHCLKKIVNRRSNPERDLLIYKYYLFGGFKAPEIATFHEFRITVKRIYTLIDEINKELRYWLKRRGVLVAR